MKERRILGNRSARCVALLVVGCAAPGVAQLDPPVLTFEGATSRTVEAVVSWFDSTEGNLSDDDVDEETGAGPWLSRRVGAAGPDVAADAYQRSYLQRFSIHGEGLAHASWTGGQIGTQAPSATSSIYVTFAAPPGVEFSFEADFEFVGDSNQNYVGQTYFSLPAGAEGECGGFFNADFAAPETWMHQCLGTVPSSGQITFLLVVGAAVGAEEGDGVARVDFDLDFGDRDHDDLLDVWEEEGIDLEELGSIPLHQMPLDADPDVKDLFVEVDVLAGAPYSLGDAAVQEMMSRLVTAFRDAPVRGSDDALEHRGIRLHLIHDESGLSHVPLVGTDLEIWSIFSDLRQAHFGEPGDSPELLQAKRYVFRYALIGNLMEDAGGAPHYGLGEGSRSSGNGLLVAAGSVEPQTEPGCFQSRPCWSGFAKSLAGVFMHELGHTLGLREGGRDDVEFKPNHLSVMNYSYAVPWNAPTDHGTNVAQAWKLEYNANALASLDEGLLLEPEGLAGAPARAVIWFQTDAVDVYRGIDRADGDPIDWSLNGQIDEDELGPIPLSLDLNRPFPGTPYEFTELLSPSDWNWLVYGPGEWLDLASSATTPRVSAAVASGTSPSLSPEIDGNDVQAFLDGEWFDLTDVVAADLSVTMSNGGSIVMAGQTTTYTIVVENDGPGDVTGAQVSDYVPMDLTCSWTCVADPSAACTPGPVDGDLVDAVDLPMGTGVTYSVECLVDPGALGPLTNRAAVDAPLSVADADPADNEAVDVDDVEGACGHPNGVLLAEQVIDTTVEVTACLQVTLGPGLEVVAPGDLSVDAARVVVGSGFRVGAGASLTVVAAAPP